MVNVARSHPLTLGFPGFGGSGLRPLGSIVVAIILVAGMIILRLFGVTNFVAFPVILDNIMDYGEFLICLSGFPNYTCLSVSPEQRDVIL
jgi:hypothetical protein